MKKYENKIIAGDCLDILPKLPTGVVDLAFADPPFNIGFGYDVYNDRRDKSEYLSWAEQWLTALRRVLKPSGSLWVAIGDEHAAEMKITLDRLGFTMRNWIIWHYTFGVNCTKKFNRSHAHLLYYVMDPKNFTFNADSVRIPSARLTKYADKRANPVGKIPDDTWIVSRVCGTFKERTNHPCQMPEKILERVIQSTSTEGDLVLDPFAGSGTTLAVAKRLKRRFIGCELSIHYAIDAQRRLNGVHENHLQNQA